MQLHAQWKNSCRRWSKARVEIQITIVVDDAVQEKTVNCADAEA